MNELEEDDQSRFGDVEKPKSKGKWKIFFSLLVGIIIGVGTMFGLMTFDIINQSCEEEVNSMSQTYYNLGIIDLINYTQSTGRLKYIEGGQIKEISLQDQCRAMLG